MAAKKACQSQQLPEILDELMRYQALRVQISSAAWEGQPAVASRQMCNDEIPLKLPLKYSI